jgi:tetratricopeptide (TPR) repeat protein
MHSRDRNGLSELAASACVNLRIYYLNDGRYKEAEIELLRALHIKEDSAHAGYNLGIIYYRYI